MTFLDRILVRKNANVKQLPVDDMADEQPAINDMHKGVPVDYNLFVDDQPPSFKEEAGKHSNPLEKFMSLEFQEEGYTNGYDFPESLSLWRRVMVGLH